MGSGGQVAVLSGGGEEDCSEEGILDLSSAQLGVRCVSKSHWEMKLERSRSDGGDAPVSCSAFTSVTLRPPGKLVPRKQCDQIRALGEAL